MPEDFREGYRWFSCLPMINLRGSLVMEREEAALGTIASRAQALHEGREGVSKRCVAVRSRVWKHPSV
jgi:hypothetical protein